MSARRKIEDSCRWFCSASERILAAFQRIPPCDASVVRPIGVAEVRGKSLAPENIQSEWLVAALLLLWGNFCRDLVAACSRGDTCREKNLSWHSAYAVVKECRALRESGQMPQDIYENIQLVLYSSDSPASQIAAARNLFAHRSHKSWRHFRDEFPEWRRGNYLGVAVCSRVVPGAGVTQMEFWVKRLQSMARQIRMGASNPSR